MEFHQFQLAYNALEDRILMRASFRAGADDVHEFRAWLSRRMVRNLWPNVLQALETQVALNQPGAAHVKADIVGMEYQATLSEFNAGGNFNAPYDALANHFPLGETPLLVTRAEINVAPNQAVRINFLPQEGRGFEIGFPPKLLHGLCTMLQTTVAQAEWDFELEAPGIEYEVDAQRVLN